MAIRIMNCTCDHAYQDRKHGKGKRVHNEAKDGTQKAWTCTVCARKKMQG